MFKIFGLFSSSSSQPFKDGCKNKKKIILDIKFIVFKIDCVYLIMFSKLMKQLK